MPLDLTLPTPLAYFAALVQQDEGLPLLEAAASLAQDDTPDLDVEQVLEQVDQLADRLNQRISPSADPVERLRAVNQFFFADLGFAGNVNDYYNAKNSYLDVVLHTRRGIPISLAVLWLELGQSAGLKVDGVGFPGHFLVQAKIEDGRVVMDPFTGQSLGRPELHERLEQFQLDRELAQSDATLAQFLQPTPPRQILARMLRNLQDIHRTRRDWPRLVRVQDRLVTLLPEAWAEYRDRGLALAQLGDIERARADLSVYLREAAEAADREAMAERLSALGGSAD